MQFTFAEIINQLNTGLNHSDNFAYQIARASVIPSDYFLASILPEEEYPTYHIDGGSMTIHPTMIGQVAQDSPLPPMGAITSEIFNENTTKFGGEMFFTEAEQRKMQAFEQMMIATGVTRGLQVSQIFGDLSVDPDTGYGNKTTINGARLNRLLGMVTMMNKAHWDRREWLRGKGLFYGAIDWTFNGHPLKVDYKIPSGNINAIRTSTEAYGGTASKFWTDIRWLYTKLQSFTLVMNFNTYVSIINQPFNNISITLEDGLQKQIVNVNPNVIRQLNDKRNSQTIYVYDKSGTDYNPATKAFKIQQFIPDGIILAVGQATPEGYQLAEGSVPDPNNKLRLGYTHIAPTVEGGGAMGTWARIFTPEKMPMQVLAQTAGNSLPVIQNPKRICLLRTEI